MSSPNQHSDNSKGEKLALRLSHILARLHQGDEIDKHRLAQEFQVDVRTIERDLGQRLKGIVERTAQGWQLTHSARSTIPAKHLHGYARMSGTEHLYPDSSLQYLLTVLDTPESQRATQIKPVAQESLGPNTPVFKDLEAAVKLHHVCDFTYKNKSRSAHPYQLIHKNGVWYLAAEEGGRLKNFSVARIEGLQVDTANRFAPKQAHYDYIQSKDDIWFTPETTEVLLRVDPEAAHYFLRRPLLPRQQERADTDGSLLVTTYINHPNQLLPMVRWWMPHVRIVKPMEWHEVLVIELNNALQRWNA